MMLRLASFAVLLIGASAECLICLDGAQPGNMGTSIPELGGFTCGYAFFNSGALTANECTTIQLPENQLICGCAALVPAVSAAPVAATISPETLAPAAETTAAPVTTVPALETAAPVTSAPVAATGAPIAMTVAPLTAAPASVTAVPVTSAPADVGTVAPVTPAPVAGTSAPATSVPATSVPGTSVPGTSVPGASVPGTSAPGTSAPGTSAPGTSAPGTSAPGTSAPGTSAPGTSAPVTGTSAPVTNAPVGGTAAPVSGSVAPGTPAPVAGSVAPGTVAPVTAAPVSETVTLAPVAPPSCTDLDRDPYEFFGNGSFIPCCNPKQQCLADWNDNNRTYYRCVDNCTASPDIPEPEIPDVCTPSNADPYQVYGNGTIIPCCNPSKQCLNRWDKDDRNYYICINETERECPLQVTSFCSSQDVDPFEYFGTGEENECCTGLYKCLDNWDDDERYYYRCEPCCENVVDDKCDGLNPSLLSPGKKGARSSEIKTLVAVPGEYGVYTTQKSILTSGTGAMTSMVGVLAGVLVCILTL